MFQFHKLLTADFWFNVDSVTIHRADEIFFVIAFALTLLGLIFFITARFAPHHYSKRLWQRLATITLTIGLIEVLWSLLRWQHVPTLASHLIATLILVAGLLWLVPLVKYWFKQYGADVAKHHKDEIKQKYLRT